MNYQVGDVVIDIQDLYLWDNVYHHDKNFRRIQPKVVCAADDKLFTCDANIDITKVNGFSDTRVKMNTFHQKNGCAWDGPAQIVNITRNKSKVLAYLNKQFDASFAKCDADDYTEIAKLKAEIEARQQQIELIKQGKRGISFKVEVEQRDFLTARKKEILDLISGN